MSFKLFPKSLWNSLMYIYVIKINSNSSNKHIKKLKKAIRKAQRGIKN